MKMVKKTSKEEIKRLEEEVKRIINSGDDEMKEIQIEIKIRDERIKKIQENMDEISRKISLLL